VGATAGSGRYLAKHRVDARSLRAEGRPSVSARPAARHGAAPRERQRTRESRDQGARRRPARGAAPQRPRRTPPSMPSAARAPAHKTHDVSAAPSEVASPRWVAGPSGLLPRLPPPTALPGRRLRLVSGAGGAWRRVRCRRPHRHLLVILRDCAAELRGLLIVGEELLRHPERRLQLELHRHLWSGRARRVRHGSVGPPAPHAGARLRRWSEPCGRRASLGCTPRGRRSGCAPRALARMPGPRQGRPSRAWPGVRGAPRRRRQAARRRGC
jgi:hypothetical protein